MWKVFVVLFVIMAIGGSLVREYRVKKWDGIGRYTVISFPGETAEIKSIDPTTHDGVSIKLPSELQITTARGLGVWRIGVLKQLALKNGQRWAGESIAQFLGIAFTGVESELSWWDKLNWFSLARNVDWNEVPLIETTMVAEAMDVDDQKVLSLDSRWGKKAREYFESVDLSSEGMQVVIVNSTNVVGLGAMAARIVDSSGIRVIMIKSDSARPIDTCIVRVDQGQQESKSAKYLMRVFECDIESGEIRSGELELVLGTKYAN